jgi:hypothetical protein
MLRLSWREASFSFPWMPKEHLCCSLFGCGRKILVATNILRVVESLPPTTSAALDEWPGNSTIKESTDRYAGGRVDHPDVLDIKLNNRLRLLATER